MSSHPSSHISTNANELSDAENAAALGVSLDQYKFYKSDKFDPQATTRSAPPPVPFKQGKVRVPTSIERPSSR